MKTRKIILISLIIILTPLFVNFLLISENPFSSSVPVASGNEWLQFWGSYSAAIITGLITLYVLFTTLRKTQKNHDRLCELQVKTIKYDKEKTDFKEMCDFLFDLQQILDSKNVMNALWRLEYMIEKCDVTANSAEGPQLLHKIIQIDRILFNMGIYCEVIGSDLEDRIQDMVIELGLIFKCWLGELLHVESLIHLKDRGVEYLKKRVRDSWKNKEVTDEFLNIVPTQENQKTLLMIGESNEFIRRYFYILNQMFEDIQPKTNAKYEEIRTSIDEYLDVRRNYLEKMLGTDGI